MWLYFKLTPKNRGVLVKYSHLCLICPEKTNTFGAGLILEESEEEKQKDPGLKGRIYSHINT